MNFRTFTRSLIVSGIVTVLGVASTRAQTDYSQNNSSRMLTVGAGVSGGISMTLDPPMNWKIGPVVAYRAGVDATYPLTSSIFGMLALGLDSRGAAQSWYDNANVTNRVRVNYFSIFPAVRFSAFAIGLNIGIPLGGVRTWKDGSENGEVERKLDADVDGLKTMIEPRIGAVIPLLDEEIGWLGITVFGGYTLNDLSISPDLLSGQVVDSESKSNTVSLQLGLTWQFGIPGTAR